MARDAFPNKHHVDGEPFQACFLGEHRTRQNPAVAVQPAVVNHRERRSFGLRLEQREVNPCLEHDGGGVSGVPFYKRLMCRRDDKPRG